MDVINQITRRGALAILSSPLAPAQSLEEQWSGFAATIDGTVGAAALNLGTGRRASLNGQQRFPLASVCKLPIAMNILAMVDEGRLRIDQPIEVLTRDVHRSVSPLAERWPAERRFHLDEMVRLMVAQSDNTAVETFYRLSGGGEAITARLRKWKIDGIRIDRSEARCGLDAAGVKNIPPEQAWRPELYDKLRATTTPAERYQGMQTFIGDPRDTATPDSTVRLLGRLFGGELLSPDSTRRLIHIMEATTTSPGRIKGLLPQGTVVAHKTGTAGTEQGLNAATNDVGLIHLPRGGTLAIAVYVKGSTRPLEAREQVIARIAKSAFDSLG